MSKNEQVLSIPEFFSGRSVLITGATGFLGKALIEKLLRSCPDTQEIFLLMRPKRNVDIDERLQRLLANPLFETLRSEQPSCFDKLIPVKGDIGVEDLGLSPADRNILIERTSVIFHVAANVRFDNSLKSAVLNNVRSTRDICVLGKRMKNLVSLVYVSSAYTQVDKSVIDEIVYPTEVDWKKTIQIAETLDEGIMKIFQAKYIGTMPNQYVFTKRLAEQVITDYSGSLPCAICRPSIVISSLRDPMKGWRDNFNGPVALLIGVGKGIVRVFYGDPSIRNNAVPIDTVVNTIIVIAWKRAITTTTLSSKSNTQTTSPLVYNCVTSHGANLTQSMLFSIGIQCVTEVPFEGVIWAPAVITTRSPFFYYMLMLLLHVIPALLVDGLLRLTGGSPRLLTLQRKIFTNNRVIAFFTLNEWDFQNRKLLCLSDEIPLDNQHDFGFANDLTSNFNKQAYTESIIGAKTFLLHESMDQLDAAKSHFKKMIWIDRIVKVLLGILFIWTIYGVSVTTESAK